MVARPDGMVLAGGRGSRLGRPKAGVVVGGTTLVERAVATLASLCARVIVVSRPDVPLPRLAVPVVLDRPGPDAPLVALASGLTTLDAEGVVVLACDLPLAAPAVERLLLAPPGVAVAAREEGARLQPLCARYPRARTLAACERLLGAGALALHDLLDAIDAVGVDAPAGSLLNLNTPEDLRRAEAALSRLDSPGDRA